MKTEPSQLFFDRVAREGDAMLFSEAEREQMNSLKRRLGSLEGLRVLEPGCGAGPLTEYLAAWTGPRGRVFAFDASEEMIRAARRRLATELRGGTVELRCERLESIPLAPSSWDRIILFRLFPHIREKGIVLNRLREALIRRGRLVIANLNGSHPLNRFHADLQAPVKNDHMPCAADTSRLLERHGFRVFTAVDQTDEFYVEAAPGYSADPRYF